MKPNPDQLAALEKTTPPAEQVRERTREYMQVAQLTSRDMASRIGYGLSSVKKFLADSYVQQGVAASDVYIRRALVAFMDAHPVSIATETKGVLYETANVRTLRHWFERCLQRREMAGAYGPPGSQKTFVLSHLIAEHNARELTKNGHGTRAYYVYCSQSITPRELLRKMALAAAVPSSANIQSIISSLAFHIGKRKSLFVLDEAQHLSIGCLEIVRELNEFAPRCGILLTGSHRLFQTFNERSAELEQWNSRVASFVALPGIEAPEVVAIVEAELGVLPTDKLKLLLKGCLVNDAYAKKRGEEYYSARRLFRAIEDIKANPRFAKGSTTNKESAA